MIGSRILELETLASAGAQGQKSDAIRELCNEVRKLQKRRDAALGPKLSEVMAYAEGLIMGEGEAEKFHDHHQARGWKLGPNGTVPMRDFKAALRTWARNGNARNVMAKEKNGSHGVG